MSLGVAREVIPPLRSVGGSWATSAIDNAQLLAETFEKKSSLDPATSNEFSDFIPSELPRQGRARIRLRYVNRALKNLDEASSIGPDTISTRVLRRCRAALALPIFLLTKVIFKLGWPEIWRLHWIHPLHKKKSRAEPSHYRGIHLKTKKSKVVERSIGACFLPCANYQNYFGENQYAYSVQRSHRDALAVDVFNWLLMLEIGQAIGLYCSDVSGAFDRVRQERIMMKLRDSGFDSRVVDFLESWLRDRRFVVLVVL